MRKTIVSVVPLVFLAACSSSTTDANELGQASSPAITSSQYVTNDCSVAGGAPVDSTVAPMSGVTLDGVTVVSAKTPTVTIAPALPAATEVVTKTLIAGKGQTLKATDILTFNYCGVGLVTQNQFDSSWANGAPITFGLSELIPGWSIGMPGMKVGEQRLLILPGSQAYGPNPPSADILPDESLAFVVELVSIQN